MHCERRNRVGCDSLAGWAWDEIVVARIGHRLDATMHAEFRQDFADMVLGCAFLHSRTGATRLLCHL